MKRMIVMVGIAIALVGCGRDEGEYPLEIGSSTFTVEIADTAAEREQGLQNRQELKKKHGMFFEFSRPGQYAIWMKNTFIPLDIVWIAGMRVVEITRDVQPEPGVADEDLQRYTSQQLVTAVVEFPAGTAESEGISVGDEVVLP